MPRLSFVAILTIIAGACGGGAGGPDASRLYVVRQNSETNVIHWYLEAFEIEPISGQLERLSLRVDPGDEKFFLGKHLLFHPDGQYIVLGKRGSFRAMSFDDDGGFTLLPETETSHRGFYSGSGPVLPHPNGRFIYAFNPGTRDSEPGVFVLRMGDVPPYFEMVGDVMVPGCNGHAAVFENGGSFLYCSAGFRGNEILTLTVEASTGVLSKTAAIPAEESVRALRFHPSGEFVYALIGKPEQNRVGWRRSWIAGYHRNPVTGRLSPVVRGAIRFDAMIAELAITPDGRFLYATDKTLGHVKGFRVLETGRLEELSGVRSGRGPTSLLVAPGGRFVYVGNAGSEDLAAFTIGDNGNLVPMTGSPIALGGEPIALAVTP